MEMSFYKNIAPLRRFWAFLGSNFLPLTASILPRVPPGAPLVPSLEPMGYNGFLPP